MRRRIRIVQIVLAVIAAMAIAGCDRETELHMSLDSVSKLEQLRFAPKFGPDQTLMYPGAPSEEVRARCEMAINQLLDVLIKRMSASPTKEFVLANFEVTLKSLDLEDSEEKDRIALYLEQIMDILGIESSDGLLNRWRYGFNPEAS